METATHTVNTQQINLSTPFRCEIRHIPIKRTFDILFSLLVLILGSPIFLLIALGIKLTSKGPIVYSHQRIGRGGKPFKCYKFRTMYKDAEEKLESLLRENPALKMEWEEKFKLTDDPRVTKFGRILRKTSLDELPQFFNVLKGDLSVVGPRPVVREEINKHFGVHAYKILSIRPGLTGPWQISGRSDMSYEKRIEFDKTYVDSHSLVTDLIIVVKTVPKMISCRGAY